MKKKLVSTIFCVLYLLSNNSHAQTVSQNNEVKPDTNTTEKSFQLAGCAFDDGVNRTQQMQDMKQAMRNYWM